MTELLCRWINEEVKLEGKLSEPSLLCPSSVTDTHTTPQVLPPSPSKLPMATWLENCCIGMAYR